jgi:hypothetical protein
MTLLISLRGRIAMGKSLPNFVASHLQKSFQKMTKGRGGTGTPVLFRRGTHFYL